MTRATGSASDFEAWDRADLIRRVVSSLEVAARVIRGIEAKDTFGLLGEKIVAETAMLLHCVSAVQYVDDKIHESVNDIGARLVPHARSDDVLAAICLDPGFAADHAFAHLLLSRLGHRDEAVDDLLARSLAMGAGFGPERVAHRYLEQEWLARVWPVGEGRPRLDRPCPDLGHLGDSMLARPLDALGSTREDIYAFTHAVMYASDLGGRPLALPRPPADVEADAVAALAHSLDIDDLDLTAELLLTWPMLDLEWNPAATFAFRLLARVQDELGFLPGSSFDSARHNSLRGHERSQYELVTCYHSVYVMGFLCAAALRPGCAPPARGPAGDASGEAPSAIIPGILSAILRHIIVKDPPPHWRRQFEATSAAEQRALGPLLLAMVLRQGRVRGDLTLIRDALELALAQGFAPELAGGAAPAQAAALLRRGESLDRALSERSRRRGVG